MPAWDKDAAIAHLDAHAHTVSTSNCATYTRQAIEAGGLTLTRHNRAKDYGSSLTAVGFVAQTTAPTTYQKGDVAVIQPIPGHPSGHMTMYDGTKWVSDFKQQHGLYPGPGYRNLKPPFVIYRHP
jgi:hypothetical protein